VLVQNDQVKMKYALTPILAALLTALSVQSARAQSLALTNADVTRLVVMGVSDQTVIAVIHEALATQFDLSSQAVRELTTSGVPSDVVAAMGRPATQTLLRDHGTATPEQGRTPGPQSRDAAAVEATAIEHRKPQSTDIESSRSVDELPTLTPAEARDLNRSKFDTVYATSKSMEVAALTKNFPDAKNAFDAAVAVARDRATTKAEQSLVRQYLLVSSKCEAWVLQERTQRLLGRAYRNDLEHSTDTLTQALALLTAANAIYLGK
jgi:hypothetical protein